MGLAGARIWPGPRTITDVVKMTASSALIPPLAAGALADRLVALAKAGSPGPKDPGPGSPGRVSFRYATVISAA